MQQTNEVVKQNTAATQRYHGHVKLWNQMALLMVLDKSPSVPYAGRSLRAGGGGGQLFKYSCSARLLSFEMDYF